MKQAQTNVPRSDAGRYRSSYEWIVAALFVLLSLALCIHAVLSERHLVHALASERLAGQAHAIESGLRRRLQGVRDTLFQIRATWEVGDQAGSAALLQAFRSLVSGVRQAVVIDREGRLLLNGDRRAGPGRMDADDLRALGGMTDAERVYALALPDPQGDGAVLRLTLPVRDGQGAVRHFIMIDLGADYYSMLLRIALETDGSWSTLSMADGALLASNPQAARGVGLWRLDATRRDLFPGQAPEVRILDAEDGPRRLLVQRTVDASALSLDQPLVLTLSRELDPLDAAWRRLAWVYAVGMVVLVVVVGGMLRLAQTRRARWEDLIFYDSLTGLPNRRLLHQRLDRSLVASEERGQIGAIVFLDLDDFKSLNDTLGHDLGDQLLVCVSERLREVARGQDMVARLGGDEFVLLLESLGSNLGEARSNAEAFGRKLLQTLSHPFHLADRQIYSTPSLGITLFTGGASKLDDLLKQADMAMYQAKASGRNTLSFFEPEMQAQISANAQLQSDLHRALEREELLLYYQPILDRDRQVIGVESLVRWRHPEMGLVSPARFIPVAEQCGLILPLGDWVLEQTCRQLVAWSAHPSTAGLFAAVNISARQLSQPDFVVKVIETVHRTGASPSRLKLELTESMFLLDVEGVIEKMAALKSHGIGFSLDDFGTGYSSLCYLQRLPLDRLKIDKSFVSDLPDNANSATIGSAIIGLAHSLGLQVIAEGVENQGQLQFLLDGQCDAFQGYLFSPPLPLEELERHLAFSPDVVALDSVV